MAQRGEYKSYSLWERMKYFYNNRNIQDPINDLRTIYGIPRLLYHSGKVYQKGGEL